MITIIRGVNPSVRVSAFKFSWKFAGTIVVRNELLDTVRIALRLDRDWRRTTRLWPVRVLYAIYTKTRTYSWTLVLSIFAPLSPSHHLSNEQHPPSAVSTPCLCIILRSEYTTKWTSSDHLPGNRVTKRRVLQSSKHIFVQIYPYKRNGTYFVSPK